MKLHPGAVESESEEIAYLSVVIFLTLFAGAMSGLTVGYLSIDDLVLELKSKTGSDVEQECARKILPILNKRHWLLVTLLLWNASAMEALPIFLNKLVGEYFAIIISVTLVLFFGEIIPQALCTGPGQIRIAAFLSPLVNFLMWISAPMSYPIALLLDYLLGKHSKSRFLNTDLKGLIEMHTLEALEKLSQEQGHNLIVDNDELGLRMEQADLMISALEIKQKKAGDIMINLNNIFMLDYDNPLDFNTLQLILEKGYSRIPVYAKDKHNILGILRIKQLIGVDIGKRSIRQLKLKLSPPIVVHPETPALDLLSEFRKGKSHMAFVTANTEEYRKKFEEDSTMRVISLTKLRKTATFERIYGMITLEDLLEKMINIEIIDEDEYARTKVKHQKLGMTKKSKFYSKKI